MDHPATDRLSWVRTRDGRLVPFDADRISRDLFTATESLGQPDAFLARELTDSVLHFLAIDSDGSVPTTGQVVDMVVKVVRELGHPALAQAFAQRGTAVEEPAPVVVVAGPSSDEIAQWLVAVPEPNALARRLSGACLSRYGLRAVFSRDLAAAHADGLLALGGLDAPLELAGYVLHAGELAPDGLIERIHAARCVAAAFVVLDGPDHLVAADHVADFTRQVHIGLDTAGLSAIVNLNSAAPPAGTGDAADGPLFARPQSGTDGCRQGEIADALMDSLQGHAAPVRIDWHLGPRDFAPEESVRLLRLARRAVDGAAVTFVFDRPRRPVALAEGLDRPHPAVLMTIGLNLLRLAAQPELRAAPERFLDKLGSLVRLALSAATQKREYLRRHGAVRPGLARGFLRDRARLVLAPIGLEAVVRRLRNVSLTESAGLSLARQIVQRLGETLSAEGRRRYLDSCLDSAERFFLGEAGDGAPSVEQVAGLTAWNPQAPLRQQLRASGPLHAETRSGTAALLVPAEQSLPAEEAAELLRLAWQQGEVCRLRFVRLAPPPRPLPDLWQE